MKKKCTNFYHKIKQLFYIRNFILCPVWEQFQDASSDIKIVVVDDAFEKLKTKQTKALEDLVEKNTELEWTQLVENAELEGSGWK